MRLGLGVMMIVHGYPKLAGGPPMWEKLGGAMASFGLHDFPQFWGFMAAFAEGIGGVLLILGLFFRPACLLLLITMIVATMKHMNAGDGISKASHAIELGIVFMGLFIIGPGRFSIDKK
jgi:putative oxidoreductase